MKVYKQIFETLNPQTGRGSIAVGSSLKNDILAIGGAIKDIFNRKGANRVAAMILAQGIEEAVIDVLSGNTQREIPNSAINQDLKLFLSELRIFLNTIHNEDQGGVDKFLELAAKKKKWSNVSGYVPDVYHPEVEEPAEENY
jgi:hypothetical protein